MASLERDLKLAHELHLELNGSNDVLILDTDPDMLDIIEISDDDTPPAAQILAKRPKTPVVNQQVQVTFENQQAITIQRERKSQDDYFMAKINSYISLQYNMEWAEVNMPANIQQMYEKLQTQFFSQWLKIANYKFTWDINGVISDGSAFQIFDSHMKVLVAVEAMVKPRIQLVSILLHVLIHIYLVARSKDTKINVHNDDFRRIMLWLNDKIGAQISTSHKSIAFHDDVDYPDFYQCTGICLNYEPFHGVIRCTTIPDSSHRFWEGHEESCGGQFFKIFEMSRTNQETDNVEKKYVRNVRYMFPKPREAARRDNPNSRIQIRELFDLTGETESATVHNLCDVIDLDCTDYNYDGSSNESKVVSEFTSQSDHTWSRCPFCEIIIGGNRLAQHFDNCRGHQQKVHYKLPGMTSIRK